MTLDLSVVGGQLRRALRKARPNDRSGRPMSTGADVTDPYAIICALGLPDMTLQF